MKRNYIKMVGVVAVIAAASSAHAFCDDLLSFNYNHEPVVRDQFITEQDIYEMERMNEENIRMMKEMYAEQQQERARRQMYARQQAKARQQAMARRQREAKARQQAIARRQAMARQQAKARQQAFARQQQAMAMDYAFDIELEEIEYGIEIEPDIYDSEMLAAEIDVIGIGFFEAD